MAIPFDCPHCGHHTEVDDRFAGEEGECVSCSKSISIPAPSQDQVAPSRQRSPIVSTTGCAVMLMVIGALFALSASLYLLGKVRAPSTQSVTISACTTNMKKIGTAIKSYAAEHGHYPPAYTTDANGNKLHSWRVLILPQLGYPKLASEIRLNEPWDSKHNRTLGARMPAEFHCPADEQAAPDETSYVAIVGEGFLFDADKTITPQDVVDPPPLTVMVVESSNLAIQWMRPADLTSQDAIWSGLAIQRGMGGQHKDGMVHVITADGNVSAINEEVTSQELHATLTIQGGETVYPPMQAK